MSTPTEDGKLSLMDLGEYLLDIATGYDRLAGLHTSTQTALAEAGDRLAEHVPAGLRVQGSGGKGQATYTPWIGFFNPDVTDSPQRGMYVFLLFSEDLELVGLTLNQGMEYLRRQLEILVHVCDSPLMPQQFGPAFP